MRQKIKAKFNMRVYFTLVVLLVILVTALLTQGIGALISHLLGTTIRVSATVWLIVLSVIIGMTLSLIVGKLFFAPVMKLSKAMKQVAFGDFSVRLTSPGRFPEMREAYDSFNRMVKDLSATEMLQSDFVSNVSHEFKTPITAIEGYATLLQDRSQSAEEQDVYVEKILFNTRRLSELVGNILLLSKVDNQTLPAQTSRYRLDEQIRKTIVLLEPSWSAKEIDFDVDLAEVEYTGSESLMQHVWSNLIGNAIKFDPYGGLIRMRLATADGQIIYLIEDNGPGIAEDAQKHIFEKFYQSDSSHKEEGNGLGLALVKRILDNCGGSIRVENLPIAGCRFTVTLPASE